MDQVAQRAAARASRRGGGGGGNGERQGGRQDRDANPYGEGNDHRWPTSGAGEVRGKRACFAIVRGGHRRGLPYLSGCRSICRNDPMKCGTAGAAGAGAGCCVRASTALDTRCVNYGKYAGREQTVVMLGELYICSWCIELGVPVPVPCPVLRPNPLQYMLYTFCDFFFISYPRVASTTGRRDPA